MISRKQYSQEFKRRLVLELLSKESSGAKICQREKIAFGTLSKWRDEFESGGFDTEDAENLRLRRENQDLRQAVADLTLQNQILKKTEEILNQQKRNGK